MISITPGQIVRLADGRQLDVRVQRRNVDVTGYLRTEDGIPGQRVTVDYGDVVEVLSPQPVVLTSRAFSSDDLASRRLVLMFIEQDNGDVRYFMVLQSAGHPYTERAIGVRTAIADARLTEDDKFLGNDEKTVLALTRADYRVRCETLADCFNA